MKKNAKLIAVLKLIISLCIVGGCTEKPVYLIDTENSSTQNSPVVIENSDIELELWTCVSLSNEIKEFETENNDIKRKEKIFNTSECQEKYTKALATGNGPDLFIFDSSFFGDFTTNGILQNLLVEPFQAQNYKDNFLGWDSGLCIDGKQLLSLTLSTSPYITYYRTDIMEKNGFPNNPEEFGAFIEKPENLLKIGKKLKEQDKYIFEFPTDFTDMACASLGYFDNKLNFIDHEKVFIKSLDLAREAYKNKLFLMASFWDEDGKKAIIEDKLVMRFGGSAGLSTLATYDPSQKGKWRVTKAPLGFNVWSSDSRISANSQSKHKEEAWKFIEYIVTYKSGNAAIQNEVEGYIPFHNYAKNLNRTYPFFGYQNIYSILLEPASSMLQYKLTPLNYRARDIYRANVWNSVSTNTDSKYTLEKIPDDLERELLGDINILINPER